MTNIPIITYVQRYWMLILAAAALVSLCLNDKVFALLGALVYIPAVASVATLVFLLIIHLFFRETIDKDWHNGTYVAEWRSLEPKTRITLTVALVVGLFLSVAIIAASTGK